MLRRVFVIDVGDGILEFINPEILETAASRTAPKGAFPSRANTAWWSGQTMSRSARRNRNGEWFEMEGEALFARAVCHENDHLDGVVFKDRNVPACCARTSWANRTGKELLV